MTIQIVQTPSFKRTTKKLHANQKTDLFQAIREIQQTPNIGELKKGDLSYLRVYKFKMVGQLSLLGYSFSEEQLVIELLALSSHENFYRDLKNHPPTTLK